MDNKKYVDLVNDGQFPENIKVPIDLPYKDERGIIKNLWLGHSGSVTLIESVKGSVRAKHRHLNGDWHATYIINGKVEYVEGEGDRQTKTIFNTGDLFFTKPEVYHEMHFIQDTKMITMNGIVKNHTNYEKSIKRG